MKKAWKKILAVVMSAAVLTAGLAGCGSSSGKDSASGSTSSSSGKWVVGTNAEFAPFEYVSTSNGVIDQYSGIDMEIIKKIGEDNGKTIEINNMEFDSLVVALSNGQLDAVIAGMTVTDERKESVDFSEPYYTAKQVMIVPEDSDIQKASDMKGKKIAVIQGYTGETAVQDLGYKVNDDYEAFKKGTEAIQELVNGKCDVVVIDSATAQQYVKDNKGIKIVEDDDAFSSEEYAIAVKKGDTETLDAINASIEKFKKDGTIDQISAKYADISEDESTASDADAE